MIWSQILPSQVTQPNIGAKNLGQAGGIPSWKQIFGMDILEKIVQARSGGGEVWKKKWGGRKLYTAPSGPGEMIQKI